MIRKAPDNVRAPMVGAAPRAGLPPGADRYSFYPPPERFDQRFAPGDALRRLKRRGEASGEPLSIYVHLPFCGSVCWHCDRATVITGDRDLLSRYLAYLEREVMTQRGAIGRDEPVARLHWGGGTPTFLSIEEMSRLMESLHGYFAFLSEAECSIEADPRHLAQGKIEALASLGFNRVSMGVHDFHPAIQHKVNRVQSYEETARAAATARAAGFRSVEVDLAWGLPGQSAESACGTLDAIVGLQPDGIALRGYVHRPKIFDHQRCIDLADLPAPPERTRIIALLVEKLARAGYRQVGIDRFALGGDGTAFEGCLAHARRDLLAFGVSAISSVGAAYSQNHASIEDYCASLDRGELPVARGHELDADDLLRREIIGQLATTFRLAFGDLAAGRGVDLGKYFEPERGRLEALERDGLIARADWGIEVTPRGRADLRRVCAAFDRYAAASPASGTLGAKARSC